MSTTLLIVTVILLHKSTDIQLTPYCNCIIYLPNNELVCEHEILLVRFCSFL